MRKTFAILMLVVIGLFVASSVLAQNQGVKLLEPSVAGNQPSVTTLNEYLAKAWPLFLGLAISLAIVMIVWGGLEYMMSEVISNKAEAKKRIYAAILGLLLVLGAYILLKTINPDIVEKGFEIKQSSP